MSQKYFMAPSLEVIHDLSPTTTYPNANYPILIVLGASPSSPVCGELCLRKVVNLEQPAFAEAPGPCFGFVPWTSLVPVESEIHADDGPHL